MRVMTTMMMNHIIMLTAVKMMNTVRMRVKNKYPQLLTCISGDLYIEDLRICLVSLLSLVLDVMYKKQLCFMVAFYVVT